MVIYGAGRVGVDFYTQLESYQDIEIILWVDQKAGQPGYQLDFLHLPEKIRQTDYDAVVIAVADEEVAQHIKATLLELGVERERIYWKLPHRIRA